MYKILLLFILLSWSGLANATDIFKLEFFENRARIELAVEEDEDTSEVNASSIILIGEKLTLKSEYADFTEANLCTRGSKMLVCNVSLKLLLPSCVLDSDTCNEEGPIFADSEITVHIALEFDSDMRNHLVKASASLYYINENKKISISGDDIEYFKGY